MARIPQFFIDCVVAIGSDWNGKTNWIGTGFFFGDFEELTPEGEAYQLYLVTNKHVINDLDQIVLRFNPRDDQSSQDFPISLKNPDGTLKWTGHPNPNIDVAVLPVNLNKIAEMGMNFHFFQSDKHITRSEELYQNDTFEGSSIFVMGFPMGMVTDRQYVFIRSGVISRIKDLFEKRSTDFVIDAFVFPGNSGGPVILKPETQRIEGTKSLNKASLIGIIKSYIPYQDIAISQQTNRPRVIFEENTGLTQVEPAEYILETVEIEKKNRSIIK